MDYCEVAEMMGSILTALLDVDPEDPSVDQEAVGQCITDCLMVMRAALRRAVMEYAMPKEPR